MTEANLSVTVAVTLEELEQAGDVLQRFSKVKQDTDYDWHILRAALAIVQRAVTVAKYGRVPGDD